jgi:thiol:disulfide interchange protein
MKQFRSLIVLLILSVSASAQIVNPMHWSFRAEHIKGNEYNLVFTLDIDKPWHGYSQKVDGDAPRPTLISIDKNSDIELIGPTTEGGPSVKVIDDKQFDVKIKIFEDKAIFTQKIKLKKATKVIGYVEAMVCNDNTCKQPETKNFSIEVADDNASATSTTGNNKKDTAKAAAALHPSDSVNNLPPANLKGMTPYYQHFFDKTKFENPVSDCGTKEEPLTTWLAFLLGFLGGLVALLTPCVFPMIPLTVSFFTKRGENKTKGKFESIFYGFCIMLIFFLLSLPFLAFNLSSNTLNEIATDKWVNVFFFVVFVIFAFSFFGYYEITLPSSFASKIDNASNVGGLIGIFFMALTLVVVSFSCTGPILGSLLGQMAATPNGKLNLVVGMTSFGFAMGLPFTLFALFPNMLKSLPKSGSWMDSLKKVLGFVELILALKFISNADLVSHLGILKREIFLIIWALLGAGMTLYLFGVYKFKSESEKGRRTPIRMIFAVVALSFTLYSAYGIRGNALPLFSGFLPPDYYSLYPRKTQCPLDLSCYHDYDEALAYAKKVNKPLFIDFTGYNCANCRKMEENVWGQPNVYPLLSEKYVVVSLYVDDNDRLLPASMIYRSPLTGDKRASYGAKWSDLQTVCFNSNIQPQYALISPGERLLRSTWREGFNQDSKKFQDFLECGLDAFKKLRSK